MQILGSVGAERQKKKHMASSLHSNCKELIQPARRGAHEWEKCQGLDWPDEQTPDCKGDAGLTECFRIHFRLQFGGALWGMKQE